MTDTRDLDETGSSASDLRAAAEDQLDKSQDASQELKGKTPEEIIHELQVHQIELEMQNEELKRIQLELDESRDKYQSLYDFSPVGYFTLTHKGIIREVNLMGASLLGTPRPILVGRGFGHFVAPEDLQQLDQHILEALREGTTKSLDIMLKPEKGSTLIARLESVCIAVSTKLQGENNGGQMIRMAVSDITKRSKMAGQAQRKSEERYRTVADFTYGWEYWVDAEGNFLYCSPACERMTGYSAKEFIDDPDLMNRIIHPDDRAETLDHYHEVRKVAPLAVDARDFRIIHRDGETRWIGHVCQPVYDQEGQPLGRRGSNRDITDRKLAQKKIGLNESCLQSLYEISQYKAENVQDFLDYALDHAIRLTGSRIGYIFHYDENNRRLILNSWSKQVMKGCEVAEPQNIYELDKTGLWGEAVRQRKAIIVNDFRAPNPLKKGYPQGHVELSKFLTAPIFKEDKIVAVVGVANKESDYDEADLRQLSLLMDSVWRINENKMVTEIHTLLIRAIESASEAIIITDITGIIQFVNHTQETLSGYSSDELVGQTPNVLKSDFHDGNFYKQLWETITAGKVWSGRFINKKKDGTKYQEDATISPVYDKSGILANFVVVEHDVTTQLELQEQLLQAQKMEAIGTLAGGFAHDFNNRLQVIGGYVEMILFNKDLPETLISELGVIKQTVISSAELIKGMMVFSRKTPIELQPIELNKLVAQIRSMLTRSIPKMIEIDLLLADDLWPINAAPNQIDQILMNLAVNARDAMPDGGKLTIKTQNVTLDEKYCRLNPLAKPGRYALITLSDTGSGMDKETVRHIFEPFFTTKEAGKGTGLGLAVVYGIVEQHGGRIICDSEPFVGTTFRIYFPAIEVVPQEQHTEKKEPPKGQGETILVVDDEPNITEFASRMLAKANYRVITASNGKEALELYEKYQEEVKLVILDLNMPVMGGDECLQALLRMDPMVRVLVASGAQMTGMEEEFKASGAKGLIKKPFVMSHLLEKIRKIIDEE
jgi:two-component system cell cycle sensor histidine kinase/response regulator CckA